MKEKRGLLKRYQRLIKGNLDKEPLTGNEIEYWKNKLFISFLFYCFPISFLAVVPGFYVAVKEGYNDIAVVDLFCLIMLSVVTFSPKLGLKVRKLVVMGLFYVLAIYLSATLGYIGPGIFYLLAITILSALILTFREAYWSIAINTIILATFALLIAFKPFDLSMAKQYTAGEWVAFSSNLLFISILLLVLIHQIFNGLQRTIANENALQEKYHTIFEKSPLPMWLFDPHTLEFLDVNLAAVFHYGYSKAEFLKMTLKDIRPAGYGRLVEQIVDLNKANESFLNPNMIHLTKSGRQIHVKIESSLLEFNGRKAKLVLVNDITDQLKAQEEMQQATLRLGESESNLRAFFDSSIEGFLLLDLNNIIKAFNPKAQDYIQLSNSKLEFKKGRNVYDYLDDSRIAVFSNMLDEVKTGQIVEYDIKHHTAESISWVHYTLTPVIENGLISGICISGRDVTASKNYQERIERQNSKFKEISFLQSHMVRAPLSRIMGLASILHQTVNPEEIKKLLSYLEISCNELDDIIKEITDKTQFEDNSSQLPLTFPVRN